MRSSRDTERRRDAEDPVAALSNSESLKTVQLSCLEEEKNIFKKDNLLL